MLFQKLTGPINRGAPGVVIAVCSGLLRAPRSDEFYTDASFNYIVTAALLGDHCVSQGVVSRRRSKGRLPKVSAAPPPPQMSLLLTGPRLCLTKCGIS